MTTPEIPYNRKTVDPVECIKAGWELVKPQYWLFVGMTFVAFFIGSAVPFGILMGPMMCGIYLALFKQRRGQLVEFGDLFKGFDRFGESLIAALLHMIPIFVIFLPTYIIFYLSMFAMMAAQGGREPEPGLLIGFLSFWAVVWIVLVVFMILISVAFTFAYPLIVDRQLGGFDAVKLSVKAARANFWGLLGLMLLSGLLAFFGILLCYVGWFLLLPITFGAIAVAYEQVFGLSEFQPNVPPPPPTFV